jgi:hypothetical protein
LQPNAEKRGAAEALCNLKGNESMSETKECIMCFSKIDARSKKCFHCRSLQAKYSNIENSPILIGLFFVLLIGVGGYFYMDIVHFRNIKGAYKDLSISVNEVSEKIEGNTLYIACLGNIKNEQKYRFTNLKLEANFYDKQDNLIDTILYKDKEISVPPNEDISFRVRGEGQKKLGEYSSCKVTIRDAWVR